MNTFLETARFAQPYFKRYWFRFIAGIVLGVLFGMSNGLFVGGTYMLASRLSDSNAFQMPSKSSLDQNATKVNHTPSAWDQDTASLKRDFMAGVDPWLPKNGRPLDWRQCLGCVLLLPIIAALRGFLGYGSSYLLAWSGQRITNDVKFDAFRKVSAMSLDFFHKTTSNELINRVENDAVGLNTFLRLGLSDLIKEPFTMISILFWMLRIDWTFTIVSLIFIPMCVWPTRRISQRVKQLGRMDFSAGIAQGNIALESFQNVRITKAYGLEESHAEGFRQVAHRSAHYNMKTVQNREMLNPIIQTLCAMGISAVVLYAVWRGRTMELPAFMVALGLFYAPVKKLSGIGVYLTQLALSLERLMDLFRFEPTVKEDPNPLRLDRFQHQLVFENVNFDYGEGRVLHDVSFTLPRGKRLGLAGESGSGKSSLLNLIFRFYDASGGRIEIDGIPIKRLKISDLRNQLALVSQDILLFNATVAENIRYGKIGATREEIEQAARRAHAADFIAGLPEGYDTPLGERGSRLSGGQRQRIAIARAFVRNAPILVLDEATASLDSRSEAEVQSAIDDLTENRTVICVAHRLSTLRNMDEILVMERGSIVERGGFDELLNRDGIFAHMAARQSVSLTQAA